jgi:AcrR family transcriptional regulator
MTAKSLGTVTTGKFHRRKDMIVRAAVEVVNQKGVRGMTLADVAAKLDLVPTAVMYYFRKKEELAAACFYQSIERYDELIAIAAQQRTSSAALNTFVRSFFELHRQIAVGEADPVAIFDELRTLQDPGLGKAYEAMFRNLRGLITKSAEGAALSRMDCNARTHLLLLQLCRAAVWQRRYDPADYGQLAGHMIDILSMGLAKSDSSFDPQGIPLQLEASTDKSSAARETFLQAATELLNEHGYLGASVQKISERLNVTKGAFYHHNETKDDLVIACFERTLDIMRQVQQDAQRVARSGCEYLTSVMSALMQYQLSGNVPLLRASALTSVPAGIHDYLMREFDRVSGRFSLVLTNGIADGSLRPVNAAIAAQMITAMINATPDLPLWAPGVTAENIARVYAKPLFEGVLAH